MIYLHDKERKNMGLGRWLQCREVRNDLKMVKQLDKNARNVLLEEVHKAMVRINMECSVPVAIDEIIFSESFHPVEDANWALAALVVNTQYRLPLIKRAKQGDDVAMFMQLAAGVVLHSIRAIMDSEVNNRNDLLMYTKSIWYYLADGDFGQIPPRFHSSRNPTE